MREAIMKSLKEINEIIDKENLVISKIGIFDGLSGLALFKFYYANMLNDDNIAEIGSELIKKCFHELNCGYSYPTFCSGIAGLGWVINHLSEEGFIYSNSKDFFTEYDNYIYKNMISDLKKGDYDFLHGAIGYAFYFLYRYKSENNFKKKENYKNYLLRFMELLEQTSTKEDKNRLKWLSHKGHYSQEDSYNLGLAHGLASIVGILSMLAIEPCQTFIKSKLLLRKTINYIWSFNGLNQGNLSIFPNWIPENHNRIYYNSRVAWCYGDLAIGAQLLYASKVLKDKVLRSNAILVLSHSANRVSKESSMVNDAMICHRSFGNAQIFFRMYKEIVFVY